jgi:hypothetical protein
MLGFIKNAQFPSKNIMVKRMLVSWFENKDEGLAYRIPKMIREPRIAIIYSAFDVLENIYIVRLTYFFFANGLLLECSGK